MKKNNIIKAVAILCIMYCALCITSCSQEENANDGKHPLELKATGISVDQTRATVDGTWTGNEVLGLMVSGDNNVYRYTADNEGNLTSTSPYYWQNTDDITVTAWYPYSASTDGTKFSHTVNDDQSDDENYNSSDLIVASNKTVSFAKSEIAFEHQTSKITVSLTWGTEFTDEEKADATCSIFDGNQYIAPNCSIPGMSYRAVIMPVKLNANTDFIKVTVDKASFYYALAAETTFDKNNSYTYSITVNKTGLTLTGCTIGKWQDNPYEGNADFCEAKMSDDGSIYCIIGDLITQDVLNTAIGKNNGKVVITGTLSQDDLDLIYNNLNSFTSLDMSGASVSEDNLRFGTGTVDTSDKTKLESISLPQGITTIAKAAFCCYISLKSITIPSSVTTIADNAFLDCKSLTSISIPNSVTMIGWQAFCSCESLTSISIPSNVKTIETSTFAYCKSLTSITIPSGVTSIKGDAFYQCVKLNNIDIPSSVTTIGKCAFDECSSLTSITIPLGVTTIEESTFNECGALVSINIPSSVTTIGDAFKKCNSLKYVTCEAIQPPTIGSKTFGYDYSTIGPGGVINTVHKFIDGFTIYVPDAAVDTYKSQWSSYSDHIKPISEKTE